jgi:CDGSH-type Zn-finger protein
MELSQTRITVRNQGPLRVEGDFAIYDQDGQAYGLGGRQMISLCRCGLSQNKPFCDGSHKKLEGPLESKAFDLPPAAPKPPGT